MFLQASSTASVFNELADPCPASLGAAGGPVARKLENASKGLQKTAHQLSKGAIVGNPDNLVQKRQFLTLCRKWLLAE